MIITFYSYKGGVGRTSLALEVAARLANGGEGRDPLRVLVWDLDLEAPGVAHFEPFDQAAATATAGTSDLLSLLWSPRPGAVSDAEIRAVLTTAIVDVNVAGMEPGTGRLGFLPPTPGGIHHADVFGRLDLPALFGEDGSGPGLIAQAAHIAREQLGWDIVVIDARTGVADLAAAAGAVADVPVIVFRLDGQDLAQLGWLSHTLVRDRQRPGMAPGPLDRVIRVATMVPTGLVGDDAALLARRLQDLDDARLTPTALVPLHPPQLLAERVHALDPVPTSDRPTMGAADSDPYEDVTVEVYDRWTHMEAPSKPARPRRTIARGADFEQEVAELVRLLGMEVVLEQVIGDTRFDIVATEQGRLADDEWLVECKATRTGISTSDVQTFASRAEGARQITGRRFRTMLVGRAVSTNARRAAERHDMQVVTTDELMTRLAPLHELQQSAQQWFGSPDEQQYVESRARLVSLDAGSTDLDASRPQPRPDGEPVLVAARRWLASQETGIFVLLGDAGAGKSTFCRRLAADLAGHPGRDRDRGAPHALVADLRDLGSVAIDVPDLVVAALHRAGVRRPEWAPWKRRLDAGEVLLVVDGLDELLSGADPDVLRSLVARLVDLARTCRVLLTSRTQYFASHADLLAAIDPVDERSSDRPRQKAQVASVWELLPFDDVEIREYFERAFGPRASAITEAVKGRGLDDLLTRPFLLKLVTSTANLWEDEGPPTEVSLAGIYRGYVRRWLTRDLTKLALLPDLQEHALVVVDHIARDLWARPGHGLSAHEMASRIPTWVAQATGHRPAPDEVERLVTTVQTALFLRRTDDDQFSFIHRSFHEFFVAEGIIERLTRHAGHIGDPSDVIDALDIGALSDEVLTFIAEASESQRHAIVACCAELTTTSYVPQASESAVRLMARLAASDPGGIDLTGAHLEGAQLADADLLGARLVGAHLMGAHLERARLAEADLSGADLSGAVLVRADLRSIVGTGAVFDGADLDHARLAGAVLERASFRTSRGDGLVLDGACLRHADLGEVRWQWSSLRFSDLVGTGAGETPSSASWDLTGALPRDDPAPPAPEPPSGSDPLGTTGAQLRLGHTRSVRALATITDDHGTTLLASASADRTVRLWNPTTHTTVATLTGHDDWVRALTTITDDHGTTLLASASDDHTVRLWNPTTHTTVATLTGHDDWVRALTTITDDHGTTLLASASDDRTIRLWNPTTHTTVATLTGHDDWVHALTTITDDHGTTLLASASDDRTIRLWNPTTHTTVATLTGHHDAVLALATLTLDGTTLLASASEDGTIRLWDPTGVPLATLTGHDEPVVALAALTDDRGMGLLASASEDGTIRLWDPTGVPVATLTGHDDAVLALTTLTLDGTTLLASGSDDRTIRLWNPTTLVGIATLTGHAEWVRALTTLTDDHGTPLVVSAGTGSAVRIWDLVTRTQLASLMGHEGPVVAVTTVTDDHGTTLLASASLDRTVRLWDPATHTAVATLTGHTDAVRALATLTVDGTTLLASASDDRTIRLWDPTTHTTVATLTGHDAALRALTTLTVDGTTLLASASDDRTIRLWDPTTQTTVATLTGHDDAVVALTTITDVDGTTLLASGSDDHTIRLWNPTTLVGIATLTGHTGWVHALTAITVDGTTLLASASADRTVRLWDPATHATVATLTEHTDWVFGLTSITDRLGTTFLASAGDDGAIRAVAIDSVPGGEVSIGPMTAFLCTPRGDWATCEIGASVIGDRPVVRGTRDGIHRFITVDGAPATAASALHPKAFEVHPTVAPPVVCTHLRAQL